MRDPVCGMEVQEPPSIQTVFNRQAYGFCSARCLEKFEANPNDYIGSTPPQPVREGTEFKIKTFLPLIVIFSIVLAFSVGGELYNKNWQTARFTENFMAAFFIIFGVLKIFNWKGFAEAYQTYDVLAKKSIFYAYTYPVIEIGLGFAYLFRANLFLTNWITVIVMSASSVGVAQALRKKQTIQCACLGVIFKIPMTKVTLFEDVLMGVMALIMLIIPKLH